ncbi:hypothetical protein [Photobacterium kishitanii]|uniref:hypothetical protein n=1 Tax=Photobacterium kishitanii TaxID=318456 RepID=UPI00139041B7|nr:hypothetical protein [Photobacterium kishitanii]
MLKEESITMEITLTDHEREILLNLIQTEMEGIIGFGDLRYEELNKLAHKIKSDDIDH